MTPIKMRPEFDEMDTHFGPGACYTNGKGRRFPRAT